MLTETVPNTGNNTQFIQQLAGGYRLMAEGVDRKEKVMKLGGS